MWDSECVSVYVCMHACTYDISRMVCTVAPGDLYLYIHTYLYINIYSHIPVRVKSSYFSGVHIHMCIYIVSEFLSDKRKKC